MKYFIFLILFTALSAFAGPVVDINTQEQFDSYLINTKFNGVLLVAK